MFGLNKPDLILAGMAIFLVGYVWFGHRINQSAYQKRALESRKQYDEYLSKAEKVNQTLVSQNQQILEELRTMNSLLGKKK